MTEQTTNTRTKARLDILLHPIRMRILMAVAGNRYTSQDIAEHLPDVPQATLYRHIRKLAKAGVLSVVEERQVRGATEKVYALISQAANITAEDFQDFSRDDHMRYFLTFIASVLDDFSRYLQKEGELDLVADGVGYRKIPLNLSDEEFIEMSKKLNQAVIPYLENQANPARKRRIFTSIMIPENETGSN
jgi:DNA-binding transcriptional ArsR family regulator